MGLALAFMFLNGDPNTAIFRKKLASNDKNANARLVKILKRFCSIKGFTLLEKTSITFQDTTFDFDAILLGFFGTIAIKAVDLQGEIYGETNTEKWVQVIENKRNEIDNPIKTLNGSVRFFKELYKAEKVKCGQADSLVVFGGKKTALYLGKNSPAVALDALYSKLSTSKYLSDNGAEVEQMKTALEKYTTK